VIDLLLQQRVEFRFTNIGIIHEDDATAAQMPLSAKGGLTQASVP
jgi:hypothetical protein